MFRFHWDGSYASTSAFLGHLPASYRREKERTMKRFGVDTLIDLQLRISSGTTGVGLAEGYKEWKKEHGLAPGRLQRTKEYQYHIKIEHSADGFFIYPFGSESPIYGQGKNGEKVLLNKVQRDYEYIAMMLEWGTKKMPARPHWMPTARRARARFPGVMREVVQAAFDRARSAGRVGGISGFSASVTNNQTSQFEDE